MITNTPSGTSPFASSFDAFSATAIMVGESLEVSFFTDHPYANPSLDALSPSIVTRRMAGSNSTRVGWKLLYCGVDRRALGTLTKSNAGNIDAKDLTALSLPDQGSGGGTPM